jgi:hypothetical protein
LHTDIFWLDDLPGWEAIFVLGKCHSNRDPGCGKIGKLICLKDEEHSIRCCLTAKPTKVWQDVLQMGVIGNSANTGTDPREKTCDLTALYTLEPTELDKSDQIVGVCGGAR